MKMKKATRLMTVILSLVLLSSIFMPSTYAASSQVYYPIDMSAAVLKSRVQQQVSQDCAVVSMVTIESYLYGATSSADKKTVYNTLLKKNGDDNYAYWGKCGYDTVSINWTKVYNHLAMGYPVIVHRPKQGSNYQHWAVVAGYKGSSTTIEKDKFIIVDVYHGSGEKDIYTSKEWRGSVSIDRMAYRKNGIAVTALSGIRFAIDHPPLVHPYGEGHGVLGYITSNENLTSVHMTVTNVKTGATLFNKTVKPASKSYLIYNLDAEFTFAKWPVGEYYFTIVAKTASSQRAYSKYFTISSGWPNTAPVLNYRFNFDLDDGNGVVEQFDVAHNGKLNIPKTVPEKEGFAFDGWTVIRLSDGKSYCTQGDWYTETQISESGYTPKIYKPGEVYNFGYEWIKGDLDCNEYTFYPVWKENEIDVLKGDANGDGKVSIADVSIILKYIAKWDVNIVVDAANVTGDEKVNVADVSLILKYITKWDVSFK